MKLSKRLLKEIQSYIKDDFGGDSPRQYCEFNADFNSLRKQKYRILIIQKHKALIIRDVGHNWTRSYPTKDSDNLQEVFQTYLS